LTKARAAKEGIYYPKNGQKKKTAEKEVPGSGSETHTETQWTSGPPKKKRTPPKKNKQKIKVIVIQPDERTSKNPDPVNLLKVVQDWRCHLDEKAY